MKAAVLAAGEGIRLHPLTSTRPKPMIKLAGKPILEYVLAALKKAGITETIFVVHYKADLIRNHFKDGKNFGVKIEYVEQKSMLGTGNALSMVEEFMQEDFILVNGDILFTTDAVKKVIDLHQKEKPVATLAVAPVENPENYGIVELQEGNRVKQIIEKPPRQTAPTNLANAGIYAFSPEIFTKVKQSAPTSRGEWEIPGAITLLINENEAVLATETAGNEWMDIGRPWDLLEANKWVLTRMKSKASGIIENGAHIIGPAFIAETARVRSGAYLEGPVFIDEEADIGPNCYIRPYTSIGRKTRIGNACEIKNSILMDSVHVGHLSYVGDSIIGEASNLAAGTITANYRFDANTVKMNVKNEVFDSGRKKLGTVLGDNVKTGINALFMPGVKVGENSWVGPNVIVQRDLPPNTKILLKQQTQS